MDETQKISPKKPKKVGRYEVKEELGRGGMATVYRGYDARFERDVAVKILPAEFLHDPQFSVRFDREAKIVATLEHPAIVPVYDVGKAEGVPYYVMRYMKGGSLTDRLAEGEMSIEQAAHIINVIAPALDEAHRRGIIHRDLKPANILFDRNGQPYLSDFGIAKLTGSQTNVTGSAIIGTPAYMSPEQAQGKEIDGRSDIYALGAIIYRMLTGARPYEGDTPLSMAIKHITDPVPDIRKESPNLPPSTSAFIYRAMEKDPDQRFQTATDLANALSALAEGDEETIEQTLAAVTKPIFKKPATAKPRKRKLGWIFAAGIALLGVIGLIGGGVLFSGMLPFGEAEPTPLPLAEVVSTSTPTEVATENATPTSPAAPTETAAPTATPVPEGPPVVGGADKIAFVANNNVWMMNMDGSDLLQLTTDGAEKSKLQWLPDRKTLIYVVGKCIQTMDTEADRVDVLTCFEQAEFLEGFQVSPSGKQIAISMNRELFILPLDLETLGEAERRSDLLAMDGCFYDENPVRDVRWSSDESQLAIIFVDAADNRHIDTVRVMDISACKDEQLPDRLDEFPAQRFTMSGYNSANPVIPAFDWDGDELFLMNTFKRNDGFGYFYAYNTRSHKAQQLNPSGADNLCCYRDARWSPDGSYFIVAFQDIALGAEAPIELYMPLYGTLGTGAIYEPIEMPEGFFQNRKEKPQFALRPAE